MLPNTRPKLSLVKKIPTIPAIKKISLVPKKKVAPAEPVPVTTATVDVSTPVQADIPVLSSSADEKNTINNDSTSVVVPEPIVEVVSLAGVDHEEVKSDETNKFTVDVDPEVKLAEEPVILPVPQAKGKITLKKKQAPESAATAATATASTAIGASDSSKPSVAVMPADADNSVPTVSLKGMRPIKMGPSYYWISKENNIYDANGEMVGKVKPSGKPQWFES
jgi:hypothetical protein